MSECTIKYIIDSDNENLQREENVGKIETIRKENVFAQFHDTDDTVVWFDIKSAIINDNRKTVTFVMSNPLKNDVKLETQQFIDLLKEEYNRIKDYTCYSFNEENDKLLPIYRCYISNEYNLCLEADLTEFKKNEKEIVKKYVTFKPSYTNLTDAKKELGHALAVCNVEIVGGKKNIKKGQDYLDKKLVFYIDIKGTPTNLKKFIEHRYMLWTKDTYERYGKW